MNQDVAPRPGPRIETGIAGATIFFVLFLLAYASSISNHLTGDSTWYAHDIMWPGDQFWHPHHLLYNPLLRGLLIPFASLLGSPDGRMLFLQWVNLAISAMASAAFYLVARRMGAIILDAAVMTLMLGLSGASWFFSSQIEVYGLTSLFQCICLLGVIAGDSRRSRLVTATGIAGALYFHQTAILMLPVILVYELARHRKDRRRLAGRLAVCYLLPLIVVGMTYLAVGLALGHRDTASFWRWLTLHVQFGYWGKGDLSAATLQPASGRFVKAVLRPPGGSPRWLEIYFGALALYAVARFLAAGRRTVRHAALFVALISWAASLAIFSTWWDATGAEFWGMVLLPCYLALSLLAPGDAERPAPVPLQHQLLARGSMACCLVLLTLSGIGYHRWNQTPNDILQAARAAPDAARDGDLILASGTDRSVYYRIYLDGRPVSVLAINVKPAREAGERSTPQTFTSALVDVIETEVRNTTARGGRCLADHWIVDGSFSTTRLTSQLVPADFVSALHRRFRLEPVGDKRGAASCFYELRLPG
ncbi:MAG TPA: hypothetical protein VFE84_07385 [Patescibacteria group bacterium]|nr:hypothetical protein [Patescibacteria group bacterium]